MLSLTLSLSPFFVRVCSMCVKHLPFVCPPRDQKQLQVHPPIAVLLMGHTTLRGPSLQLAFEEVEAGDREAVVCWSLSSVASFVVSIELGSLFLFLVFLFCY